MTDTEDIIDFSVKPNDTLSTKQQGAFGDMQNNEYQGQDDEEVLTLLAQIQQNEELIQSQKHSKKSSKRVSINPDN